MSKHTAARAHFWGDCFLNNILRQQSLNPTVFSPNLFTAKEFAKRCLEFFDEQFPAEAFDDNAELQKQLEAIFEEARNTLVYLSPNDESLQGSIMPDDDTPPSA